MKTLRRKLRGKFWRIGLTTKKAIKESFGAKDKKTYYGGVWPDERVMLIAGRSEHRNRQEFIDSVAHEVIHVECPDMTEGQVRRVSESVAKVLDPLL